MQEMPLTIDRLNLSCVATGDSFTLDRVREHLNIKGRPFALIEGSYERSFEPRRNVYAIITPDTVAPKWRFAHMTQTANNVGFFFLANQSRVPQFVSCQSRDPNVLTQITCQEERAMVRRNVLNPYTLPIAIGSVVERRRIKLIGDPLYHGDNTSALVPVQFEDETHGIVNCFFTDAYVMEMRNTEAEQLVAHSTEMPKICSGMGSSVWHIWVLDDGERTLIKSHYNDKADRGDVVLRS